MVLMITIHMYISFHPSPQNVTNSFHSTTNNTFTYTYMNINTNKEVQKVKCIRQNFIQRLWQECIHIITII